MSFIIFEKHGQLYSLPTTLPKGWKPLPMNVVENHLKNINDAIRAMNLSKNATWDRITQDTIIFHMNSLAQHSRYLYSDLKWTFFTHMMAEIGFNFVEVSEDKPPFAYPLEEVR